MSSIAEALRAEDRAALAALSPAERITLALELGAQAVRLYASARQIPFEQAQALLRQGRQIGRSLSRCMSA